jgi:hypothetical protein
MLMMMSMMMMVMVVDPGGLVSRKPRHRHAGALGETPRQAEIDQS